MTSKNHHLIANLTAADVFVAVRDDETERGRTVLTFLLRRPGGRTRGAVHRIVPRHYVGIAFEGRSFRYRIENAAGVVMNPGNLPDGRFCWAITGFVN